MALYQCIACGGVLEEYRDELFKCPFCGSVQTIDKFVVQGQQAKEHLSAVAIENVYKSAIEAMVKQEYENAIRLFSSIRGYLDTDVKLEQCKKNTLRLYLSQL